MEHENAESLLIEILEEYIGQQYVVHLLGTIIKHIDSVSHKIRFSERNSEKNQIKQRR